MATQQESAESKGREGNILLKSESRDQANDHYGSSIYDSAYEHALDCTWYK